MTQRSSRATGQQTPTRCGRCEDATLPAASDGRTPADLFRFPFAFDGPTTLRKPSIRGVQVPLQMS